MRDLKEKLMEKLVDEVCKQARRYADADSACIIMFDDVDKPKELIEAEKE